MELPQGLGIPGSILTCTGVAEDCRWCSTNVVVGSIGSSGVGGKFGLDESSVFVIVFSPTNTG